MDDKNKKLSITNNNLLDTGNKIKDLIPKSNNKEGNSTADPFSPTRTGLPVIIKDTSGNRIGNVWSPTKNGLGDAISNFESGSAAKIYYDSKTGQFANYPSSSMTYKDGKITLNVAKDVSDSDWYKNMVNGDDFKQLASLYKLDPTGKTEIEVLEENENGEEEKVKKTINDLLQGYANLLEENSKKYQSNIDTRTLISRATKGALNLTDNDLVFMNNFSNFSKDNYGKSDVIFLTDSVSDFFKDYDTYNAETKSISADTFYKDFFNLNNELPDSAKDILEVFGDGELGDDSVALQNSGESDKDYAIDLISLRVSQEMVDIVERLSFYKDDLSENEKAYLATEYAKCYSLYKTITKDTPFTDTWTGFNLGIQSLNNGMAIGLKGSVDNAFHALEQVTYAVVDTGFRVANSVNTIFSWMGELLDNLTTGGWEKMTQETRNMYEHFDEFYQQNQGDGTFLGDFQKQIKELGEILDAGENLEFSIVGLDGKPIKYNMLDSAEDLALSYANTEAMTKIGEISGLILNQILITNPIGSTVGGVASVATSSIISYAIPGKKLSALLNMAKVFSLFATNASNAKTAAGYLKLVNLTSGISKNITKVGNAVGFVTNLLAQGVVDTFLENPSLTDALMFNQKNKDIAEFQNEIRRNVAFNIFGEVIPFAGKGARKGIKFVASNTKWGAVTQAVLRKAINAVTLKGRKVYEGIAEFMTRNIPEEVLEQTDAISSATRKLHTAKEWQAIRKEIIAVQEEISNTRIFRGDGTWSENAKTIEDLIDTRIDLETKLGLSKKIAIAETKNSIIKNAGLDVETARLSEQTAELTILSKKMRQTNLPGSFSKETGDYINDLHNRQLLEAKDAALLSKGKLLSKEEQEAFDILKARIKKYEDSLPAEYADAYKNAVKEYLNASYRFYDKLSSFLSSDAGANILSKEELARMRSGLNGARYMHQYAVNGYKGATTIEDLLDNPSRVVEQGKIRVEDIRFNKQMFSDKVTYFDPNFTREMVLSHYANIYNGVIRGEAVARAGRATSIQVDSTGKILKTEDDITKAKRGLYKELEKKFRQSLRETDGLGKATEGATEHSIKKFWSKAKRSAQRKVNDILGLNKKGLVSFASTINSEQIHQISTVYSMPKYSARIKTEADLKAMYEQLSPTQKEIVRENIPGFEEPWAVKIYPDNLDTTAPDVKYIRSEGDKFINTEGYHLFAKEKLIPRANAGSFEELMVLDQIRPGGNIDWYNGMIRDGGFSEPDAMEATIKQNFGDLGIDGGVAKELGVVDDDDFYALMSVTEIDDVKLSDLVKNGNYTLTSPTTLYKGVGSEGNRVNRAVSGVEWLREGPFSDRSYQLVTIDENATSRYFGKGDKYILRYHLPEGQGLFYFDRIGRGARDGGAFIIPPIEQAEIIRSGAKAANGAEYVDIYLPGVEKPVASTVGEEMLRKWNDAVTNNNLDVKLSRQYVAENPSILNSTAYKDIVAKAREESLTEEEALALKNSRLDVEEAEKELLTEDKGVGKAAKQLKGEFKKAVHKSITESVDATAEALIGVDNQYLSVLIKQFESVGVPEDLARKYIVYQWMHDNIEKNGLIQHIAFDYYGDYSKITGIKATKDSATGYSKNFREAAESVVESKLNKTVAEIQEIGGADNLIDMASTVARTDAYLKDISDMYGRHEIVEAWDRKTGKFIYYRVDRSTYNLVTNYPTFQKNNIVSRTLARLNAIARVGQITLRMASLVTQGFKDTLNAVILGGWDQLMLDNPDTYKKIAEYIGDDVVKAFKKEMTPSAWQDFLAKASFQQGVSLSEVNVREAIAKAEVENSLLGAKIKGAGTSSSYFNLKNLYEGAEGDTPIDTWAENKSKWQRAYSKASSALRNISRKNDMLIDTISDRINFLHTVREEFLRKQVYRQNFMDALASGKSLEQARSYARYFMENATTNFSRGVAWGNNIVRSIPYFGAMLNGASSMIRLLEVDPLGVMMRFTTDLIVPTVGLTVLSLQNEDDAEIYKNIPEWEKENNLIWVVNGQVETVPIPEELAKFILPIRHAVEVIQGTNEHAWHELLLNDILNMPTIPLNAVMMLDDKKIYGDPTVLDRISALALDLFNTLAPNAARTAYIATTGRDPYTGEEYGRTRLYEDQNGEYQYMSTTEYGFVQDMANLFKGWGWEISPLFAEGLLSSFFGTGSLDLVEGVRDFISSVQQGEANITNLLAPSMERAGNVLTGTTRTDERQADIAWYSLLNGLKTQKNELLSPSGKLAQYAKDIDLAKTSEEKAKKVELYNSEVRNWQNSVMEKVKWYTSEYGDYFDRYKFASTISYMTTELSIDNIKDSTSYYNARAEAVKTMYDAGFTSPNDNSVFGYATIDQETGAVEIKYTEPLIITLSKNLLWYQDDSALAQIKEVMEYSGLKDKYRNEFLKKYNEAWDRKDDEVINKLAAEWDVEVMKTIKPIIDQYEITDILNNSSIIDYLDDYIKVPYNSEGMGAGQYYSSKTGLNKQKGYAKSYINKIYEKLKEEEE